MATPAPIITAPQGAAEKAGAPASPGSGKTLVGNYRFDQTIGSGTYGKVKLAFHVVTGDKAAVKIIEKAQVSSPKQVARLQREILFLKLLHHPNIVQVHDVIETDDAIYIFMEYASGGELFDYIVANKRVKEKEAREFFRMVLSAVDYCHKNAVIHRDLKPENLLLDAEKRIKIIDFGFGNNFWTDGLLDTFCGSPFYAAPEMILGKKYEGPEVDMWSLGVILFALLCGHLPFDDDNMKELYRKIASGQYVCPDYLMPNARHLISRLITVDPKKRATLDEVLRHAWVNEGHDAIPQNHLPARPHVHNVAMLDGNVVSRLLAFNYTLDEVHHAFREADQTRPNPIRATYFLLLEMLQRDEARRQRISETGGLQERLAHQHLSVPSSRDSWIDASASVSQDADQSQVSFDTASSMTVDACSRSQGSGSGPRATHTQMAAVEGSFGPPSPCLEQAVSEESVNVGLPEPRVPNRPPATRVVQTAGVAVGVAKRSSPSASTSRRSHVQASTPELFGAGSGTGNRRFSVPTMLAQGNARSAHTIAARTPSPPQHDALAASQNSGAKAPHTLDSSTTSATLAVSVNSSTSGSVSSSLASSGKMRELAGWFLNVSTTSTKPAQVLADEIAALLDATSIEYDRKQPFLFSCTAHAGAFASAGSTLDSSEHDDGELGSSVSSKRKAGQVSFQLEICKVPKLNMVAVQFKRLHGGVWTYKRLCSKLLAQIPL